MILNAIRRVYDQLCLSLRSVRTKMNTLVSFWTSHILRRDIRPKPGIADIWMILVRLAAISVITTGIVFGAIGFRILLKETNVFWYQIDPDLQLAFLGFFNKMLDVLLISSLEYTASIVVTAWMTAKKPHDASGATFGDFELKNELTKPWMTIWAFVWRWKRFKFSFKSLLRFLLCLCVSVCVLLQGLAINTIAIPKIRWYPNLPTPQNGFKWTSGLHDQLTVRYPKVFLEAIDWSMHMKAGYDNIGVDGASEWALVLSASRSLDGLSDIVPVCSVKEKGWHLVHARDLGGTDRHTGLNTNFDATKPVESLSIIDKQVWQAFDWLRKRGHYFATGSIGWTGNLTLVVPVLNTVCKYDNDAISAPKSAITVIPPGDQNTDASSFKIKFGPTGAVNMEAIECTITFRQALHSFAVWIVKMDKPDISQNHYYSKFDERLVYEEPLPQDHKIALSLAVQTQGVLERMDRLTTGKGLVQHLLLFNRKLQSGHNAIQSDPQGLAVIMAVLIQNLISYSDQIRTEIPLELSPDPADVITSFPMQWQLYGSGPRLAWQWITVFVLAVVLFCFCYGLWQTLWYWMAPGEWTEVPGMMVLAQVSGLLQDIEVEEKASQMLYYVATESGKVMLGSKKSTKAK